MKRICILLISLLMISLNTNARVINGDIDGDGMVGINDVTTLIDYVLSRDDSSINLENADINKDGIVDIADVTSLIDILLGNNVDCSLKLSILVIGNSFSCDAFSYLPFILKQGYGIDIDLGIIYNGGAYTEEYVQNYTVNVDSYYHIDTENDTAWIMTKNVSPRAAVMMKQWDLIVLQQGSSKSFDYANYDPSVGILIGKIQADFNEAGIGWNINHIGTSYFTADDQSNWTNVLNCCRDIVAAQNISFVFPYGTAVFNAMEKFKNKGSAGYMTFDASGHLQEGLPCYLAAIAQAQALFDRYYHGLTVVGDSFVPNTRDRIGFGHANGGIISMSAADRQACQDAAIAANQDMFTVNPIN